MYDDLLDNPISQFSLSDFEEAIGAASLPPDQTHWYGHIPRMDGIFWTPGRFPKQLEDDPAWLTQEAVTDDEVVSLPICMAEIDEGTFPEQGHKLEAAIGRGLPPPSAIVISGDPRVPGAIPGKSLHLYWTLDTPFDISEVERWKNVQRALIKSLGGDPKILNPSRKMRVGGVVGGQRYQTLLAVGEEVTQADMEQWARGVLGQKASSNSAFAGISTTPKSPTASAPEELLGTLVLSDGKTQRTVADWWDDAGVQEGQHWNVCCSPAGSKTAGSAFVSKEAWGVRMTCVAGHHNHPHARANGTALWAWHSPFLFRRGDDLEVAERVLLVDIGKKNAVATRSREYLYDDGTGVWTEDGLEEASLLFHAVSSYGGHLVATANGAKELKMGNVFISCAIRNIAALTHSPRFFDDRPEGVACRNGFLEPSGNTVPLDRSHRVRGEDVFPLAYTAGAPCPRWLQFLDEVFETDEDKAEKIDLLQEFVGACLFGVATEFQRHVVLLGPKGANGKSVLLKTIKSLFPHGTVASSPMQDWPKQFGLSWVPGTLLNVITEMPERDLLDSGPVKAILSGDPRAIEEKFKPSYDAVPKAGHILAANTMPFVADHTEAFYRRFMILGFNRTFQRPEQDPSLVAKLKKELEGIFSWAVQGYHRLKARGDYVVPESSDDLIALWALGSDSTADFAREHLVKVSEAHSHKGSSSAALYLIYREWCQDVGNRPVKQRNFCVGLRRAGYEDLRARLGNTRMRAWNAAIRSQGGLPRKARIAAAVGKDKLLFMDNDSTLVDTATSFVSEWIRQDSVQWCSNAALYEAYCQSAEGTPQSKKALCSALKNSGAERQQKKVSGKPVRGWKVSLLKNVEMPKELIGEFTVDPYTDESPDETRSMA